MHRSQEGGALPRPAGRIIISAVDLLASQNLCARTEKHKQLSTLWELSAQSYELFWVVLTIDSMHWPLSQTPSTFPKTGWKTRQMRPHSTLPPLAWREIKVSFPSRPFILGAVYFLCNGPNDSGLALLATLSLGYLCSGLIGKQPCKKRYPLTRLQ